ncbi:DNA-binding transcriptional regulator, LacI/PurR family [Leifsonia sp. 98AMF]|uniref:LacI family DNA-binding transcriptional regulator n=1 Tax=unclassified Leifsonia TaxID=2663824 RepID=UPI00087CE157|nr:MULTISPECIES: LacI family DNA-binding transcriptional regulator [unclassified Leifsonia]MDR6611956.1 DNA-binding LacI/PurR family transcriptional regulator [Leifsonia sp. 1010]SDH07318.1 DNA-binding transcriptional regulator, LacI/PurR family [Leifsonia sp. 197AMF]SDJ32844.1 DNA-binding transcriptional regulator, LacI/PurR family [Leifsonia sp. 466MF]SDK47073.1 DNA-binding transcriptional regulator, LacI/PurR family [Leifsonia sp. 157MF]SDN53906.1 DNA-binding transcriptional regulator, LacI
MGDERVTIVDVANKAGVAISSVSSALNGRPGVSDVTRERIIRIASELGFVPSLRAKSLSGRRAFTVGLVLHRDPDVLELDPFFGGFIGGIEDAIDPRGYALVLQISAESDKVLQRYEKLAADRRVDGVFINDLEVDDPRIALVQRLGLPAVAINPGSGFPIPAVREDPDAGIRATLRHLVDLGHRRIAYVSGRPNMTHSVERENSWRAGLRELGLEPGPVVPGEFTYLGGAAAASILLDSADPPTAVMCANDLSAIGLIAQAQHLGVDVPGQLSVAGFDDIRLGTYVRPSLTTVHTSPRTLGRESGRMLVDLIEEGVVDDVRIPDAEMIVRDSTGPARSQR